MGYLLLVMLEWFAFALLFARAGKQQSGNIAALRAFFAGRKRPEHKNNAQQKGAKQKQKQNEILCKKMKYVFEHSWLPK